MMYQVEVVAGRGRGKRIGFPTLNFKIPGIFPYAYGIYAGWVIVANERHQAVFHYGPIPTFEEELPSFEAFLLDGIVIQNTSMISIELVKHLREIKKFDTVQELTEQISKDIRGAKKELNP